ncbi:MATE family efflux transporter [Faecalibacterium gallinarum]|uniref:Probable multidrug resistance protein NorM n=1 Tax=Faecalibacterium gallinarum TaxID=2903556 RepID=A0AA37MYE9_9FIRM|nr:MATE family efflux transporter [Faecalibacterium gallinarum]GJN64874.1 MATE family efflux transporter [Faecalibacterium gallinarum]
MTEEQNLLSGSVPKKLAAFAFPLLLANILQSFYNVVDMLVVGQIVGDTGLAAINNASKLCYIINSICIGMTMGGAVLIAQYKGANDKKGQAETFQTLAILSFVSALLVTVIGLTFYQSLFRVLNVPADAYQDACDYMKIICWGTIFVFGYNAVCSVLKGLGDSKSPLYFVGIATIINIVLDILLVGPFGMGTAGAAYATITAQGISFVISIFYLRKHKVFFSADVHKKFTLQMDKLVSILKVGLPTAIQMVVVNTAYLLVTGMLNQFGTSVSAASGVGLQINTFAGMPCWAIGQAVTAMVGQCMGAGEIKRARKVVKIGLLLNISVTLVVVIGVQVFAEQLILLFGSTSAEVINDGVYYLRVCCGVNSLIYAAMYTLDSFAIGVGAANIAMVNALLDAVIVRLPVSWLLAFTLNMGFPGIYYGQALSPILPAIVGFLYFQNKGWERKTLIQKKSKI